MKPTILKTSMLFLLLELIVASCKKEATPCACGVDDPLDNVEWMKSYSETNDIEIYSVVFNENEFIGIHFPQSKDERTSLYDCQGNLVCIWGAIDLLEPCSMSSDFYEANKKLMYKLK
jgi:hypothetical protein